MIKTWFFVLALFTAVPMFAADVAVNAISGSDGKAMLIPVAGRVAGAGGELFFTDLTLVNLAPNTQNVRLTWLPLGGTATPQSQTVPMERFTFQTFVDVIGSVIETGGVGAILIEAVDAQNNPVSEAALDAHARIWTDTTCASLTGTVSQSVPAVTLEGWRNGSPAYIHGVRDNERFHTNYGIVNLDANPRAFRVVVNSVSPRVEETVTVPGLGTVHRRVPAGAQNDLSIYIEPILTPPGFEFGPWRAYAATTDNKTGSGWTVIAIQPRTDVQF